MRKFWAWVTVVLALLAACGSADETASLAIRVHSLSAEELQPRRFFPHLPEPDRVLLQIWPAEDLGGEPLIHLDEDWQDLPQDPVSGKKYLLVTVPSREEQEYFLRLASRVRDGRGVLQTDECGAIGHIRTKVGAKTLVEMVTHPGPCATLFCQSDSDCRGEERYCLSFECQEASPCHACPLGAYCDPDSQCAGSCAADDDCADSFGCCGEICSIHCFGR